MPTHRTTHTIDAAGTVLGRLASQIAVLLRGKHKPTFRPHEDAGDIVVVKNLRNLRVTGRKMDQKLYHHFSGYPGGLKTVKLNEVWAAKPEWVLRHAVERMLPKNRLRKQMLKRLMIEKPSM